MVQPHGECGLADAEAYRPCRARVPLALDEHPDRTMGELARLGSPSAVGSRATDEVFAVVVLPEHDCGRAAEGPAFGRRDGERERCVALPGRGGNAGGCEVDAPARCVAEAEQEDQACERGAQGR